MDRTWPSVQRPRPPILTVPFVVYLLLTERNAYGESWPIAAMKAAILTGWPYTVVTAYRFILFFTVFYAT